MPTRMQTHGGHLVDLLAPSAEHIDIRDIAHHLARINRYSGALGTDDYSVAEHSIHCQSVAEAIGMRPVAQLHALLHDGHEAYTGDISTPMKRALCSLAGNDLLLEGIEERFDHIIWKKFGRGVVSPSELAMVKRIDKHMARIEAESYMPTISENWTDQLELLGPRPILSGGSPDHAKQLFMHTYHSLIEIIDGAPANVVKLPAPHRVLQ